MAFDIGINVVEVDGSATPSITGAATSVAGFNILTQRGIPNQPAQVTSFPQFVERFGGYFSGGKGAYMVRGFFDNGGQIAYINRIVDPAAAKTAKRTLTDGADANTLLAEAGFLGAKDPGSWGRDLYLRITHTSSATSVLREKARAVVTSSQALADTIDMSGAPPDLSVIIDEAPVATVIKFAPATDFAPDPTKATPQQIVTAINSKTPLLQASIAADKKLVLTSTGLNASHTSLQVNKANDKLGFAAAANPTQGTPEALTDSGAVLATPGKFTPGDALVITGPGTAAGSTVTKNTVLSSVDPISGVVTWDPKLTANQFGDDNAISVSNAEFDLSIAKGAGDVDHVVETYTSLTMQKQRANNALTRLNHPLTGSKFILLTDLAAADADSRPKPTSGSTWLPLDSDGIDGAPLTPHFTGDQSAHTGFFAFDPYAIQLLCCERDNSDIVQQALTYCANRGDAMFIGAVPQGMIAALDQAIQYGSNLQSAKAYGALYGPWIVVPDPIGVGDSPRITIAPTGHVMGVYARIETTRGIWKAPAGDEANLRGVLDVETRLSDADHTALVKQGCINGIRAVPRAGVIIDASRTLSSDPRWTYVNVRLLFNYVKSSLRDGLRWVRQEPNTDALWRSIRVSTVTPFLLGLWRQGAFGTGTPQQTFTVIVDETNNPPDQVDQGMLKVEVYFYPSRPAETIVILVGQQPSGATVSEA